MPKQVDHQQRRHEIAAAVGRITVTRGVQGVTFREVAAEAGVSVSLVQHYFGTKEQLLVDALDIQSAGLAELIGEGLDALGQGAGPLSRVRAVAASFLPTDDESRVAMLLYLGFAGAALTDARLRGAETFRNADSLVAFITRELAAASEAGRLAASLEPQLEAQAILSLVLGLSLAVLLERTRPGEALDVLDAHLSLLGDDGQQVTTP